MRKKHAFVTPRTETVMRTQSSVLESSPESHCGPRNAGSSVVDHRMLGLVREWNRPARSKEAARGPVTPAHFARLMPSRGILLESFRRSQRPARSCGTPL